MPNVPSGSGGADTRGDSTGSYSIQIQDRLHVDTRDDTNTGTLADNDDINTLREAIAFANDMAGSQTITFRPSVFTSGESITLSVPGTNQLEITDSVVIEGPGMNNITIDGNDNSRVFLIDNGSSSLIDVEISGLTIRDGNTSPGLFGAPPGEAGAGILNTENLTLRNVTVTSNTTLRAGSTAEEKDGGGIHHSHGTLQIEDSTVFANSADDKGGGVFIGASTTGSASITNSTFSNNTAKDRAGALNVGRPTVIRNSTFTGNRADSDGNGTGAQGGIFTTAGNLTMHNTIVAGNFKGTGTAPSDLDSNTSLASGSSHNLIGSTDGDSGGLVDGDNGNIVGVNGSGTIDINTILDTTLDDNGGPTMTHALVTGSPAINAGSDAEIRWMTFSGSMVTPIGTVMWTAKTTGGLV